MHLRTLIVIQGEIQVADVEINLTVGLPKIEFLGLPDQSIKESEARIKNAIRASGYQFPRARQILVNIKPNNIKKSSCGLELAVAIGILHLTQQYEYEQNPKEIISGELSLDGGVTQPLELNNFFGMDSDYLIFTGEGGESFYYDRKVIKNLTELTKPFYIPKAIDYFKVKRPLGYLEKKFTEEQRKLIELVSVGNHSIMLAGPAGVGKTTLAKSLHSFMTEPSNKEILEFKYWNKNKISAQETWRPLVCPHHSSTPLSMIGGGVVPLAGEVTKAHRGMLLLDEFLEYSAKVQEMLREPMQEKQVRIARTNGVEEFPADFLAVATTNLCPCGKWLPREIVSCERSSLKCRSYRERLVGPVLDRFEILCYLKKSKTERIHKGLDILQKIEEVRGFKLKISRKIEPKDFAKYIDFNVVESERRKHAIIQVAKSLADLDMCDKVRAHHVDEALNLCWRSFTYLNSTI